MREGRNIRKMFRRELKRFRRREEKHVKPRNS